MSDESDSGNDADDEEIEGHIPSPLSLCTPNIRRAYTHNVTTLLSYEPIPKAPAQLPHVLTVLKTERPDHFHDILCVDPETFNKNSRPNQGRPCFF